MKAAFDQASGCEPRILSASARTGGRIILRSNVNLLDLNQNHVCLFYYTKYFFFHLTIPTWSLEEGSLPSPRIKDLSRKY